MSINVNKAVARYISNKFDSSDGGLGRYDACCCDGQYAYFVGSYGNFVKMDIFSGVFSEWIETPFGNNSITSATTDFTNVYLFGSDGSGNDSIAIYNISQGTFGNLINIPHVEHWGFAWLLVANGLLYISNASYPDVYVYDISNGTFSTIQNATGGGGCYQPVLANGKVYIPTRTNQNPIQLKLYEYTGTTLSTSYSYTDSGDVLGFIADGTNIYWLSVSYQTGTDVVSFDCLTGDFLSSHLTNDVVASSATFIEGTTLYVGGWKNVYTYDTQNETPSNTITFSDFIGEDDEHVLYLTGVTGYLYIVTALSARVYVEAASSFFGTFPIPFGIGLSSCGDINAISTNGGKLYAVGSYGYINEIDLSDQESAGTLYLLKGTNGVYAATDNLLSCAYSATKKLGIGSSSQARGFLFNDTDGTYTYFTGGGRAITAMIETSSGFYFATSPNVSLDNNPPQISEYTTGFISQNIFVGGEQVNAVCSSGDLIFWGGSTGAIAVLDTTTNTFTQLSHSLTGGIGALVANDGFVYVGTTNGEFAVYNISAQIMSQPVSNPFTGAITAMTTDGVSVFVGGEKLEFAAYSIADGTFGSIIDITGEIDPEVLSELPVSDLEFDDDVVYIASRSLLLAFEEPAFIDTVTGGRYNNFVNEWKDGNTYSLTQDYENSYIATGVLPYGVADSVFQTAGYRFNAKISRDTVTSPSDLPSGNIVKITNSSGTATPIYYTKDDFQSDGSFVVQVAPTAQTLNDGVAVYIAWSIAGETVTDEDYTGYWFDLSNLTLAPIPVDTIVAGSYNDSTGEWSNLASYSITEDNGVYKATGDVPYAGASVLFPTAGYRLAIKISRSTVTNRNQLPAGNILMVTDTDGEDLYKYYDRTVFENDGSMIIVFAPTATTLDTLRYVKIAWTTWGDTPIASDYTTYTLDFSGATLEELPSEVVADVTVGYPITPRIMSDKIVKVLVPEGGLYAGQLVDCVSLAPVVGGVSNNLEVYTATAPTTATLGSKFIALIINGGLETLVDGRRPDGQPDYTRYKYVAGDVAPAVLVDKNICFEVGSAVVKNGDALNIKNDIGKYIVPTNGSYNGGVSNIPTQGNHLKIIGTHDFPVGGKSGAGFVPTYVCRGE